jgi:exosortase/archaeosortase family protein
VIFLKNKNIFEFFKNKFYNNFKKNKFYNNFKKNKFYIEFKKNKMLFFLSKFFIIFFVLSNLINFLDLTFFLNIITKISASYLSLQFIENQIFVSNSVFVVTNSCTGLVSASILAAVIFALKKPKMYQKLKLFIFGTLLLLVINVPRIIFILFVAKTTTTTTIITTPTLIIPDLIHTLTWFLMSFIVIVIWYFGTKSVAKIKEFGELL